MKKIHRIIILILSVVQLNSSAQNDTIKVNGSNSNPQGIYTENDTSLQNPSDSAWKPCTSPFIEILGKGFLSLNVDFRKKESWAISFGFLFEGLTPNVMYYHFFGKRHRLELGGGSSGGFSNDFNLEVILIHGGFGYRYQKKKGLFFRAGFTPFYVIFLNDPDRNNQLYPWAGLSLGYSF